MDRLTAMRVFAAVAEQRSFASAARRLSLSAPAVTRAVAGLETALGARLLHRTTRVVRLSDAGKRYLADCKRILSQVEDAEAAVAGEHGEPRGVIGVTASVLFGRMHVTPLLVEFLAAHPDVTVRALMVDRVVDLVEEGVDVAIRIGHLPDSTLTALKVGEVRPVLCASPRYLKQHGVPRSRKDLEKLQPLLFSPTGALPEGGRAAQLVANTADVTIAAAVAGRGYTRALSYQVAPELAAGRLRLLLPEQQEPPLPVHVVHAAGRDAAARVRAFVDFAVAHLRAQRALRG